ncbi:AsnC family transcriptional regulator [Mesorhizobium sp. C277A]|uniref:AsnC family transcriptional regulator n=1 Tax=Mesorhizobium sp. C277A TaxID=2956827 RepID=UPI00333B39AC
MALEFDEIDRRLLAELQRDGTLSVDQLSESVAVAQRLLAPGQAAGRGRRHHRTGGAGRCRQARARTFGVHPDPHLQS